MKNIFKLGSVFMALALVVSTLLFTGVLASADQVVATWSGHTNYVYAPASTSHVFGTGDQPGDDWKTFAGNLGNLGDDQYVKITVTANFVETPASAGFKCRTWSINTAIDADSISATTLEYTINGPLTYNGGDPNLEFVVPTASLTGLADDALSVSVTVYKVGGSSETTATGAATEAEPTATAAPTEPAATADWQLIWTGTIDQDFNSGESTICALSYTGLDEALANEVDTFGISEQYKIDSTDCSFVSGGYDYAYWILSQDDPYAEIYTGAADLGTVVTFSLTPDEQALLNNTFHFALCGDGGTDYTAHIGEVSIYAYRLPATEPTETGAEPTATEVEPTETGAEPTETGVEPTETGAEPTATEVEPTVTEAEPTETGAEPTATEAEPTATEVEPTVTEAEPTATEAEPTATEAEPTAPVSLVETVLVENNVGGTKALKPEKTDAWFLVVNEIKADAAANGPIDPDKGEYYQIIVTGSVDIGEADFHLGEGLDWNEYWGESGCITTEPSTVVATIPVAIPAEGIGDVYLADSGEAGHVLNWTYAKVSVFRVGEPTEPVATESEPIATETEPTATETGSDVAIYGDANGDGAVNLKDVLAARKYVAGMEVEIDLAASDVNFDGVVNMKDILLIRKFIASMITSFTE